MTPGQEDWSEDQLFTKAGAGHGGAPVEASRRLKESINQLKTSVDELRTSSDRYATWMLWLTVVLTVLTAAQLVAVIDIIRKWLGE